MAKNRINKLRKSHNITLKALVKLLEEKNIKVNAGQISSYEKGTTPRNDKIWKALAEIFDVDVSYLMGLNNIACRSVSTVDLHKLEKYLRERGEDSKADTIKFIIDCNLLNKELKEKLKKKFDNKDSFSTSTMLNNPEWVEEVFLELTDKQKMQISKIFHIFSIISEQSQEELLNYAEYLSLKRVDGELKFSDDSNSTTN